MLRRTSVLPIAIAILVALSAPLAEGQRRDRQRAREHAPPADVPADAAVQWTIFVSAYGDQPARREVASIDPGTIAVPAEGWSCTYSAPTRAQIDERNWSEVRTLECTRGDAVVSTTGFCQIAGPSWGARAGVLSLGARGAPARVSVTLDCAVSS